MTCCLSCYKPLPQEGICSTCRKSLKLGTKFNGVLSFSSKEFATIQRENMTRISISGIQDKISLRLIKGVLVPTSKNGEYILKPAPNDLSLKFVADLPANEHLTMYFASRVIGLNTARHTLVRFKDGPLAYLTLRFDRIGNNKIAQEDFCQLAGRTEENYGKNYKYDSSYESAIQLIDKFVAASIVEKERFFRLMVFNYMIGNGDAHLKNFSLSRNSAGDYVLSPAYDLLNTSLHLPNESRTALDLFQKSEPPGFLENGFYTGKDFFLFSKSIGLNAERSDRFLKLLIKSGKESFPQIIKNSFLSTKAKQSYQKLLKDRIKALSL